MAQDRCPLPLVDARDSPTPLVLLLTAGAEPAIQNLIVDGRGAEARAQTAVHFISNRSVRTCVNKSWPPPRAREPPSNPPTPSLDAQPTHAQLQRQQQVKVVFSADGQRWGTDARSINEFYESSHSRNARGGRSTTELARNTTRGGSKGQTQRTGPTECGRDVATARRAARPPARHGSRERTNRPRRRGSASSG
jgi:hypothetical protein